MTAPAITKTCPTCGAPITREDLSLCSYCGSPVQLGGVKRTAEGEESPHKARLGRMSEKDDWASAIAWEPLPASRYPGARVIALPLLAGSLSALLITLLFRYEVGLVVGSIVLITLFGLHLKQDPKAPRNPDAPLLKRASIVLDRRSETELDGAIGHTNYYFTLEFADGASGEFRFPGRGAAYELMVNGGTGVAYTRGADLLAFKKIRV
ncbi:MAG: zinc ribbon domain-containing protein [Planctomycetota bacterium]|jgi:hypothetical protein|nr:zinc ribbon domain-containing protein [Planctomycetota bacterium]